MLMFWLREVMLYIEQNCNGEFVIHYCTRSFEWNECILIIYMGTQLWSCIVDDFSLEGFIAVKCYSFSVEQVNYAK